MYHAWMNLPLTTRYEIASQFGIIKKNPTHVFDNVVKDDGFIIKDIEEALTIDALQKYLGNTETDHTLLWNMTLDKIEGRDQMVVLTPENFPQSEVPYVEPAPLEVAPEIIVKHEEEIAEVKKQFSGNKGRPKTVRPIVEREVDLSKIK